MTSRPDRSLLAASLDDARAGRDPKLLRTSSGQHAAAYIRQLIFDGELRPGERVPQEEIAQALGISRTPVREALVAIEQEGRVVIEMHRGAFVTAITEQSVRDNQEVVETILGLIIRRATERATDEQVEQIQAAQARIDRTSNRILFRQVFNAWQDLIMEAGSAGRLAHILVNFRELAPENFYKVIPGTYEAAKKGTVALTKAIAERDPDAAVEAFNAMSQVSDEHLIAFYRTKKLFAESAESAQVNGTGDGPVKLRLTR